MTEPGATGSIIVVSAHLDDGVLSASAQLVRPGAVLLTLCAGLPDDVELGPWDRFTGATDPVVRWRERLAEDDAAAAILGATPIRLAEPDDQHIARDARAARAALAELLAPELAGAAEVWVPAGIGCHPDHLATRDAALSAAPAHAQVHIYADVPYSTGHGWAPSVTGAAAAPHLDLDGWFAAALVECRLPADDRDRRVHVLDEQTRRRKVDAMNCYATQLPALDPGRLLGRPEVAGFEVSWSRR